MGPTCHLPPDDRDSAMVAGFASTTKFAVVLSSLPDSSSHQVRHNLAHLLNPLASAIVAGFTVHRSSMATAVVHGSYSESRPFLLAKRRRRGGQGRRAARAGCAASALSGCCEEDRANEQRRRRARGVGEKNLVVICWPNRNR